ncbi:MAG TPA: VWA domain-containing protein [Nocardioidaceae bacterium]|nr:VWA domain-containing protein [Nocardioidaceae bacterium]
MTVTALPVRRPHEPDEVLAAFAAAVRASGVPVTMDRTQAFLRACALLGAGDRSAVYWAGRATLCASADELGRYDSVFDAWFSGQTPRPGSLPPSAHVSHQAPLDDGSGGPGDDEAPEVLIRAAASSTEVLRHRDVAELSRADRARLARLFATLRPQAPERVSARRRPSPRGAVDARRTLRRQLRNGGEPSTLEFRARTTCTRRVVVLVDVSGSMGPYADSLLRWAHTLTSVNRARTEVFTIGTRLTRVTRAMRVRDGDAAVAAAGDAVPDWSGGTRLGEVMQAFLDRWGQRGVARGAVVVIMSDGWERGDSAMLSEQMRRLHRLAHRVVWVNPHQGKDGYLPVQGGIVAAMPYIDDFVAGHSMATFEQALEVVARA